MSGLLVLGLITAIIVVFNVAVVVFGVDSRPAAGDERFGSLS